MEFFNKETSSLSLLRSRTDPKEAQVLVRLECGILMATLVMELVVLVLTCTVHSYWVRGYEGAGGIDGQCGKMAEVKAKELDERMRWRCGRWMKTDYED
ncbi:hypothetical protein ACJRO7_016114 [Eucalyptus globulus]|uniref:Transmembrane protein n=1 Tax=Eucalyptus globulus TaxID=34317 RepID=A0ABD3L6B4_EUCGL